MKTHYHKLFLLLFLAVNYSYSEVSLFQTQTKKEEHSTEKVDANKPDNNQAEDDKKKYIYLFDLKNRKMVKTTPPGLYNRVYSRWDKDEKRWVLDMTSQKLKADKEGVVKGDFANPSQFLIPGAVLPGEWLGEDKDKKFVFVPNEDRYDAWKEAGAAVKILKSEYQGENKPRIIRHYLGPDAIIGK